MTIRLVNQTVMHCTCVWCGYEWDTLKKPIRCAGCKRHTWNGEDKRRVDPLEFVPPGSILDGKLPEVRYRELLETLMLARGIVAQLISDYGPCNHPQGRVATDKEDCVCHETEVLAKINRQIDTIQHITGNRNERHKVTA